VLLPHPFSPTTPILSPSLRVNDAAVKSGRPGRDADIASASMRTVGTARRIMVR
ncbi:MAG: hypothetical protein RJA51_702, partial [Actinomycetota bacterium]